jgi:hypothetical protein
MTTSDSNHTGPAAVANHSPIAGQDSPRSGTAGVDAQSFANLNQSHTSFRRWVKKPGSMKQSRVPLAVTREGTARGEDGEHLEIMDTQLTLSNIFLGNARRELVRYVCRHR